jgi:hypothetical protein
MKICLFILTLMFITTFAYADYVSPAVDFFMHGREYDTFLRDHYRFEEQKPLQIEYNYVKWLDSNSISNEYSDNLRIETTLPIYKSKRFIVDIPLDYSRNPIWAENDKTIFGCSINTLYLSLTGRLLITDNFRSIIGFEYNTKGDSDTFAKADGRMICIPKLILSYELPGHLNVMAGAKLNKYYYDPEETDYILELDDRLYCQPVGMVNWHPSDNFIILLGMPYSGVSIGFGDLLKMEVRGSINQDVEVSLRTKPINRTNITLRFFNTPFLEIPVESFKPPVSGTFLSGRISHTRKTFSFEAGRELNPGALASLGLQYSPGSGLTFKEKKEYTLDGKPNYSIGARLTVDIEALLQLK